MCKGLYSLLLFRILPSTSDRFLLKNLVSGVDYNLCVLAIFDDTVTSLAATKVLGCASFSTKDVYPACRSLQAHFLGGTLTILVGGVVVVTLLVFTVALMVRHRVCNHGDHMACHSSSSEAGGGACCQGGGTGGGDKGGTSGCYQPNGSGDGMMVVLPNGVPSKRGGEAKDKDKEKEKEMVDCPSSVPPKLPPKPRPKPKVSVEQFLPPGGAASVVAGSEMALVVRQRKLEKAPPYSLESDRTPLYYVPSPPSTLPRHSNPRSRPKTRLERELTNRASFSLAAPLRDEMLDWGLTRGRDKWNSSQAYQSPLSPLSPACGIVSKRRHSLDMGSSVALATDAATTVAKRYGAVSYAKRLSVIWTRRSQSLHGMLVQCASTASTASSTTSDEAENGGLGARCELQRGYIHAYNTTNSNSNTGKTPHVKDKGREKGRDSKGANDLEESVV